MAQKISKLTINASLQKVWDALTQPALVKQWQYGSDLITDWKPGSDIRFITAWEDKIFEQWGKVLELRPPELIKYSLFAARPGIEDKPENYFIMIYALSFEKGQTKLTITQEDNRQNAVDEESDGEGNPVLQSLKKLAETNGEH